MEKDLRSLIQEVIPMQLRVDLVLLNKRRDLSNKEKMDKLLNLLRDYNISNVVQLGLGTNRYGFKIGYFVVKYALDKHGAVDNLNEFIYAKRVYPNGIKIHEVMENGILCVCEYIQPFSSFTEMLVYKEKIRKILKDLSSYYLIGDVGLEAKNYANWGLRSGTDDPVMLDYAYIYDVKSEIFVCREKGCGGILIPDDDYTYLYCNHCKKKRSFASLRDMIKNTDQTDLFHDLSQYGYEMEKANETVELDPSRSTYLQRRIKRLKCPVDNVREEKEIEFNFNPYEELQEENVMDLRIITEAEEIRKAKLLPIQVFTTEELEDEGESNSVTVDIMQSFSPVEAEDENQEQILDDVDEYGDDIEGESDDEKVVYTYHIEDETETPDIINETAQSSNENSGITLPYGSMATDEYGNNDIAIVENSHEEEVAITVEETTESKKEKAPEVVSHKLPVTIENLKYFEKNIGFCISKLSNTIRDYFANGNNKDDLFEMVSSDIKNKRMLRDNFYKEISHSCFKAFRLFLKLKDSDPNAVKHDSNSLMFEDGFLDNPENKEYYPTMVFLYRWFSKIDLNSRSSKVALQEYNEMYSDYNGIQKEWLDIFKAAFAKKININDVGSIIVVEEIEKNWCDNKNSEESEESEEIDESTTEAEEIQETDIDESKGQSLSVIPDTSDIDQVNKELLEVIESEEDEESDEDEFEEDEDEEESEDEEEVGISVSIFVNSNDMLFNGCYVTGITDDSDKVDFAIPIRGNIHEIDPNADSSYVFDSANGYWDWLSNFMTDLYFSTSNPEKYMKLNNDEDSEFKFVIVAIHGDVFDIGVYPYSGMTLYQDNAELNVSNDPIYLGRVNKFISDAIGNTPISMRDFHHNLPEVLLTPEEEIAELFEYEEDECVDEDEEDEEESSNIDESAMQAAIDFVKYNKANSAKESNNSDDDTLPVIHRK